MSDLVLIPRALLEEIKNQLISDAEESAAQGGIAKPTNAELNEWDLIKGINEALRK